MSRYISEKLRLLVSERAGSRCEYCLFRQKYRTVKFQIEHILPVKHGGTNDFENLALACAVCNLFKGSDVGSFDFETDSNLTRFFNPRIDVWTEHFRLNANAEIIPLTAEARVTARILRFNDSDRIEERLKLIEVGLY